MSVYFVKLNQLKKSIMSPRISHRKKINFPNKEINRMKKDLAKLRKFVTINKFSSKTEVGDAF